MLLCVLAGPNYCEVLLKCCVCWRCCACLCACWNQLLDQRGRSSCVLGEPAPLLLKGAMTNKQATLPDFVGSNGPRQEDQARTPIWQRLRPVCRLAREILLSLAGAGTRIDPCYNVQTKAIHATIVPTVRRPPASWTSLPQDSPTADCRGARFTPRPRPMLLAIR